MQDHHDPTEDTRRAMCAVLNAGARERAVLEQEYGQVWDTQELTNDFEVLGFLAPLIVVRRKTDGVRGTLLFQHAPRFYWGFEQE